MLGTRFTRLAHSRRTRSSFKVITAGNGEAAVRNVSLVIVLSLHLTMPLARGQDTRTLQFTLGAVENDLDVRIEYLDPSVDDPRLGGSLVLPVSFEVRNISSRPVRFNANDVRLNLGGTRPLSPVSPAEAAREIRRMNRLPRFL